MPADFIKCVREGGSVSTKNLPGNKYVHLCKDKDGKWHRGDIKNKKEKGK